MVFTAKDPYVAMLPSLASKNSDVGKKSVVVLNGTSVKSVTACIFNDFQKKNHIHQIWWEELEL